MAAEGGENDNGGSDENVTRSIAVRCVKHSDQFLFLDMILILFLLFNVSKLRDKIVRENL